MGFNIPIGIAAASDGTAYVIDTLNHQIKKITKEGVVTPTAGSIQGYAEHLTGTDAQFNSPRGIAVDPKGTALYVADTENHRIRKLEYKE